MRSFLVAVAICVTACGGWSRRDTLLELGVQATLAVDWRQTQACVDRANGDGAMSEQNPIIGDHGQNMSPNAYFLSVGLLHMAIAAVLPPKARLTFQSATLGMQVYNDWNNHETFEQRHAFDQAAARR